MVSYLLCTVSHMTRSDVSSASEYISRLKQVTVQLSQLDSSFCSPQTKERWFLGSAVQHVVVLISSLTDKYDSLEMQLRSDCATCSSEDSSVSAAENGYTQKIDSKLNALKESIMRIIQVLYKKLQNNVSDSKECRTEGNFQQMQIIYDSVTPFISFIFMDYSSVIQ
jgi:hypothetical protein